MTAASRPSPRHLPAKGLGLRRVVIGTDFSIDGNRALQRAALLSLAPHAALLVTHVVPPRLDPAVTSLEEEVAEVKMKDLANRMRLALAARRRGDVVIKTRVLQGRAPEVLNRLARAFGADLVVVGRRGGSKIRDLIMGTTARRLLHRGRLPVLVVSGTCEIYRTAVVGFDFSPESLRAGRLTRRLMPHGATLVAVHGFEDPYRNLPLGLVPESAGRSEALREVFRLLHRVVRKVGAGAKPWQIVLKNGDPRRLLLDTAVGKNADLVAVGSSGKSRIARSVMGSVAEALLDRAPCDVLLVRRKLPGLRR